MNQTGVNQQRLDDKVAIVTGGSRGIGLGIVRAFTAAGARVMMTGRKAETLEAAARETEGEVAWRAGHAGRPEEIEACVAETIERFGRVDILVNNAATNPVFGPLLHSDALVFDKIMGVNVKGPFELARRVQPSMLERGGGSVINISSVGGVSPEHLLGLYSVSKAALISLTKVMAKEWGSAGIRANAICPGLIKTKFSKALWSNEAILKTVTERLPLGRMGSPEEVAGLAVFLASDASSYCTGGVFTADGGYLA